MYWPTAAPHPHLAPGSAPNTWPATSRARAKCRARARHTASCSCRCGRASCRRRQEQGVGALLQRTILPGKSNDQRSSCRRRFHQCAALSVGIPMWCALNGPVEIELEGILRVNKIRPDRRVLRWRTAADFAKVSLQGTHNVPADQLATDGLRKVPPPSNDFNIVSCCSDATFTQARALGTRSASRLSRTSRTFPGTLKR